jgi:CubicO group peptidase (beta-lactamase class C family)/D-alanyl-D-alanine dipeptidase
MKRQPCRFLLSIVLLWSGVALTVEARQTTDYGAVRTKLAAVINRELLQKGIPSAYIALVDHQEVVWMEAFGFSDSARVIPASTHDVHRIASVSKLFTDMAVMQLEEQGMLSIDVPITTYVPEVRIHHPYAQQITLRHLMSHRAGLVREPPVGNYFDPTEPTLRETIESLNNTTIVYEPGTRYKYSNAGIGLVGYVLERVTGVPFATYMEQHLLSMLTMKQSSFTPRNDFVARIPRATLWTYDGRRMNVPSFQFGMSPAANMYSTLYDLTLFVSMLFNDGSLHDRQIVKRVTLEEMWKPQFVTAERKAGVGLGFFIEELEGRRRIGHSGDVYGFATEVALLPEMKLGVIVVNTMNAANAWSEKVANYALRLMLAQRNRLPLPELPATMPVSHEDRMRLHGRYTKGTTSLNLTNRNEKLYLEREPVRVEVRKIGNKYVVDDLHSYGAVLTPLDQRLVIGQDTFQRSTIVEPAPLPKRWEGLIGEYGWDHNTLYIVEHEGTLHALIEWYFRYPLKEVSEDEYKFPNYGLYHGEQLKFRRDDKGVATEVVAANVLFRRRGKMLTDQSTFKITPLKPVDYLRREAMVASPPRMTETLLAPELVELTTLDSTIRLDIRYATTNNFVGAMFYSQARAFLQRPAAEALVRAHRSLREQGYGLLIHDAYRPWYVTKMFWDATPDDLKTFVADPSRGSRHNRGCAVDLTLYELASGRVVEMVSGYDEFTPRAFPDYPGGTSSQRWHRELLRRAMEAEGFDVYEWEWWHFDYRDWRKYPVMNVTFEKISP